MFDTLYIKWYNIVILGFLFGIGFCLSTWFVDLIISNLGFALG